MEKLIDLLNEREKTVNWVQHPWWCKEHLEYQCHWPRVINKRFWFIERLVKNNKIDFDKLEKIWHEETVYEYDWQYKKFVEYSNYETLLMILSISDTPIDFLCDIIKN